MNVSDFISYLQVSLGTYLPSVIGAVAILLVGVLTALVFRAAIRKLLNGLQLDQRIGRVGEGAEQPVSAVAGAASVGFWFVIVLTLIAVFSILQFNELSQSLSALVSTVMVYLPRIVLATILALVAWLLASASRMIVNKAMASSRWDEKLSRSADVQPLSSVLGNVLYWFTILLFLPAIAGALSIDGLMGPLSGMTDDLLAALPNVFAATLIGVVGWLIARVLRGLVSNLLQAAGVDKMNNRAGLTEGIQLSQLGGTLAFTLVIVPALIASLQALQITAISDPASDMLSLFLLAIPNILAATVILMLAWFVGRFIASLLTSLLENLGFNRLPEKIGFATTQAPVVADEPAANPALSRVSLSQLAGQIALWFTMLFATVEAAHRLGFSGVKQLLQTFIGFGADVLLGVVIFVIGFWLANLAARAVQRATGKDSVALSRLTRVAILGLVLAMGLRAMGIADEIVDLAFGLILGSAALAAALAFGLGGRKAAGTVAQHWADTYLRKKGP